MSDEKVAEIGKLDTAVSHHGKLRGTWVSAIPVPFGIAASGDWVFSHSVQADALNVISGCFRPKDRVWYLNLIPDWTALFLVPLFAFMISISLQQHWKSRELIVQVVLSLASFFVNRLANRMLFVNTFVVAGAGPFVVSFLGHLLQRSGRKFGGTGFTTMLPAILFLVPVSAELIYFSFHTHR